VVTIMAWRRSTSEVWQGAEEAWKNAGDRIKGLWGYGATEGEGISIPGAGLVKGAANVVSRTAGRTVERTGEALQHRVVGPIILIAALVTAFNGIKSWFSRKSQSDEIEQEKARGMRMEAAISQIENGGPGAGQREKTNPYQIDNPYWQGGWEKRVSGNGPSGKNKF